MSFKYNNLSQFFNQQTNQCLYKVNNINCMRTNKLIQIPEQKIKA